MKPDTLTTTHSGKAAKVSISMPAEVLESARAHAKRTGRSLSNYMAFAVQRLNNEVARADKSKAKPR